MLLWTFASALRLFNLWYIVDLLQRAAFAEHLTLLKYGTVPTSFPCNAMSTSNALWVLYTKSRGEINIMMTWWHIQKHSASLTSLISSIFLFAALEDTPVKRAENSAVRYAQAAQHASTFATKILSWLWWKRCGWDGICWTPPLFQLPHQHAMTGYDPLDHISAAKQLCTCTAQKCMNQWTSSYISSSWFIMDHLQFLWAQSFETQKISKVFSVWASNEWLRQQGSFPVGKCKFHDYYMLRTYHDIQWYILHRAGLRNIFYTRTMGNEQYK